MSFIFIINTQLLQKNNSKNTNNINQNNTENDIKNIDIDSENYENNKDNEEIKMISSEECESFGGEIVMIESGVSGSIKNKINNGCGEKKYIGHLNDLLCPCICCK